MSDAAKCLVVLRAGKTSLHRNWTTPSRTWKFAISSFSTEDPLDHPEADYFHFHKGGKWDGIYAFFQANPDLLQHFDLIWLPDDDIDAAPMEIDTMFNLAERYQLEVSQPSLTRKSYFYHPITLHNPLCVLRYTNFVEVMVPVLNRDLLLKILPLFCWSKSGYGFDYIWARLTTNPATKCAILDEVSLHHTRPVGSVLAKKITSEGSSTSQEMQILSSGIGYDLERVRPVVFRIKTRFGFTIYGQKLCGVWQFIGQFPWLSRSRTRRPGMRVFGGSLYSHFAYVADLTSLKLNKNWRA